MSTDPIETASTDAFGRLHPKVREVIWQMQWPKLRPIQVEAIHEIFDGTNDLIISARTAAGKTEAAFLPIISKIADDPSGSVRAIYAGPLKALINDQFLRLERLCELAEIPVHKWHGDVGAGSKKSLLESPSGILLITPESIESLFVNHSQRLGSMFSRLEFIVIDEMHSFLESERGAHLRSLISRLETKAQPGLRRVGLSATIGDIDRARGWLRPGDPSRVNVIHNDEKKGVRLKLFGYLTPTIEGKKEAEADDLDELPQANPTMLGDVFSMFQGKSALIFANSKRDIEKAADFARRESQRRGLADDFRVHHGSLSKGEREETEDALRSNIPTATFCSSTLEMGIDVGNVTSIGQIGSPWSVNSMTQRLGRSGRRDGESSEMRLFIEEYEPDSKADLIDRLFPRLLQAIALVELMLTKWCEPPRVDRPHLSTLVQQTLSFIAETGGATADVLFDKLVANGGFREVGRSTFAQVLRSLGTADLIEQTGQGLLILGLKGETIVRSHEFYVCFAVERDFRVMNNGRHVGNLTLDPALQTEGHLILAGRRWKILNVDSERRVILVEPSPGGRAPHFHSNTKVEIHPEVRATIRELLTRTDLPAYLDPKAAEMLTQARATAREAGLPAASFVTNHPDLTWFPWTGSRIQNTLYGLGLHVAKLGVQSDEFALTFKKCSQEQVIAAYRGFLESSPDPLALAANFKDLAREKYDSFLSEPLLVQTYAQESLDLPGALDIIRRLEIDA